MKMHSGYLRSARKIANTLLAHPTMAHGEYAAALAYSHIGHLQQTLYGDAASLELPPDSRWFGALELLLGRLSNPHADPNAWEHNVAIAMGTMQCLDDWPDRIALLGADHPMDVATLARHLQKTGSNHA